MPRYHRYATLVGPTDAVVSVSISKNAKYVAATGYSGVNIWDLQSRNPMAIPTDWSSPEDDAFVITFSKWLYFEQSSRHVFLLGGRRGGLNAWHLNETTRVFQTWATFIPRSVNSSVVDITTQVYADKARIAVLHLDEGNSGTSSGHCLSVWELSAAGTFKKIFTITPEFPPKTVHFDKEGSVWIFAVAGGTVLKVDPENGDTLNKRTVAQLKDARMVSLIIDEGRDRFIVNTIEDIQMFRFSDLSHLGTFESSPVVVMLPRQLAFIEEGSRFVAGSDSGYASIYQIDGYVSEEKLLYPKTGLVQPVAGYDDDTWTYTAIAGSSNRPADVVVFRRARRGFFSTFTKSTVQLSAALVGLGAILAVFFMKMMSPRLPSVVWPAQLSQLIQYPSAVITVVAQSEAPVLTVTVTSIPPQKPTTDIETRTVTIYDTVIATYEQLTHPQTSTLPRKPDRIW